MHKCHIQLSKDTKLINDGAKIWTQVALVSYSMFFTSTGWYLIELAKTAQISFILSFLHLLNKHSYGLDPAVKEFNEWQINRILRKIL